MSLSATGYRALPEKFPDPARARRYTADEFNAVEVRFTGHPSVCIQSMCTATPTMGMDIIDGNLAQDAEEYLKLHGFAK